MGRKLLGVVIATGLVAAGLVLRWAFGSDGSSAEDRSGPVVHCVPELAGPCADLDATVVVEPAAATFERLVQRDAEPVVWVTMAPWPAMVDDARQRAGIPPLYGGGDLQPGTVAATTALAWVGWTDRLDVLTASCGLGWDCLVSESTWAAHGGDAAWGRVRVGLDHPSVATATLAVVGSASGVLDGARVGSVDVSIRLRALAGLVPDATPPAGSALAQMLVTGPAGIDVSVEPAALAEELIAGSARGPLLSVQPLAPEVLVAAQVVGPASASTRTTVAAALAQRGWGDAADAAGVPTLSGGAAIALWREVQELVR